MDVKMNNWLTNYLQLDKEIESHTYRKNVTSRFILLLSLPIIIIFMIGHIIYGDIALFYVNFSLLSVMSLIIYYPRRQRQYDAHLALHVMGIGVLLMVFFNQGEEYTPIWSFLYIFLVMSLYGHKLGLKISCVYLIILLLLLFSFTGSTVTMMEFFRFTMVSCFTVFFAYLAEMLISRTFEKLIAAKTMLEQLTKTDSLTGLFNRRHFDEVLPHQMSIASRNNDLLALTIIDIDHFKRYNDTYGHPAGDIALIAFAKLLKIQMKRSNDAVFRLGGEEFALIYQVKDHDAGLTLLENIRIAVENLDKYADLQNQLTMSAGLLLIEATQNITAEQAYQKADTSLYEAKNSGRNKVVASTFSADT